MIIVLIIFSTTLGKAQPWELQVDTYKKSSFTRQIRRDLEGEYKDSLEVKTQLEDKLRESRNSGYLAASFDSLQFKNDEAFVLFYPGERFRWGRFSVSNWPDRLKANHPSRQVDFSNTVHLSSFSFLQDYILTTLKNNGYPFPSLRLTNVSFPGKDTINAILHINPGQHYVIDTIYLKGKTEVHKNYLFPKLRIFPGMLYDASALSQAHQKIQRISFLTEAKPFEINFSDNGRANLYLYLKKENSNRIGGMIGFVSEENQSLQLTGNFDLVLNNAFHHGETMEIHWERFEEQTQQLDLKVTYPYLFFQRMGIRLQGNILKQDTSYITSQMRVGFPLEIGSNQEIEIFGAFKNSKVISTGESVEPDYRDSRQGLYGLGYGLNTLDYELNPSSGILLNTRFSVGNKKTSDNRSVHFESDFECSWYQAITGSWVVKSSLHSAYMHSWKKQDGIARFAQNELFRLGGNQLLRGFQEHNFYASAYAVATLELRYLLGRNSNVLLFYDGGYYRNDLEDRMNEDHPMGIGAGIHLDTGRGIVSLSYALGRDSNSIFEVKNAKIHVGYINKF